MKKNKLQYVENINTRPWFKVEGNKIKIPTNIFINFLKEQNFRTAYIEGRYQIVQVTNNIVTPVKDNAEIIDLIVRWVNDNSIGEFIDDVYTDQVLNAWINKTSQLFSPTNLKFLPMIQVEPHFDTQDSCFLYFRNTAVKISKDKIKCIAYKNLDGYVFRDQIVDRDFNLTKTQKLFTKTPFAKFVYNISNKKINRFKSFISVIGYLLHRFQVPSNAKAIILLDGTINELDGVFGGSGKSLFAKSLKYIRNLCEISGKDFTGNSPFAFQRVTQLTNIVCINDVKQNQNFENFFGRITDGFTINKKYRPEVFIDFPRSPKMIITSNYMMKEPSGNSSDRRKYEIELSTHYNKDRTVEDDFGHFFFDSWSQKQWDDFTLFMIQCIQYYLVKGLVEAPQVNLLQRRLITEVGPDLLDFLEEKFAKKPKHHKRELLKEFIEECAVNYKYRPTARTFTVRVKKYFDYKGIKYRETPSNTKVYFEIITDEDPINYTIIDDVDTDYRIVDSPNKMTRLVKAMTKHFEGTQDKLLALDFETTGLDPFTDEAVCLALSFLPKAGYNIMLPKNPVKRNKLLAPLLPFIADDSITKIFHNAKFDLKFFKKLKIELGGELRDTMVMDYLLDPSRKKHGLKEISKLHLNYQQVEFKEMTQGKDIREVDLLTLTKYACEDTDLTLQLYHYLTKKLN